MCAVARWKQTPSPTANGKLERYSHVLGVLEGLAVRMQHAPNHMMGLRGLHHGLRCTSDNSPASCLFLLEAKSVSKSRTS